MTDAERAIARELLSRAGISADLVAMCAKEDTWLRVALEIAGEFLAERPPDDAWFKDLFHVTGDHMVLTDEGWVPADCNLDPEAILDEVNGLAPATGASREPKRGGQRG